MRAPQLLPYPRQLRLEGGACVLSASRVLLESDGVLSPVELRQLVARLNLAAPDLHLKAAGRKATRSQAATIRLQHLPDRLAFGRSHAPEAHALRIERNGIHLAYRERSGLRAGVATLCQLLRQYGRGLRRHPG